MRQDQDHQDAGNEIDRYQGADQGDDDAEKLVGQSGVKADVVVDLQDQQEGQAELQSRYDDVLILPIGLNYLLSNLKYGCQHVYLPFRSFPSGGSVFCYISRSFRT